MLFVIASYLVIFVRSVIRIKYTSVLLERTNFRTCFFSKYSSTLLDNFQERMPTIAEILKSKITKDGISKTYVASELKVTEKTIENYMRGKREPDTTTLVKLSKLLDFDLNELSEQSVPEPIHAVNEDPALYVLPIGDLKITLKDHFDLIKEMADKAEKEKDRLFNLLENKLSDILSNSRTTLEDLARIQNITVADDAVNMAYLDKAQGLAPGTSAAIAGSAESALNNLTEHTDNQNEEHKPDKKGKQKKQA